MGVQRRLWLVLLAAAAGAAAGTSLGELGRALEADMADVMEMAEVQYSDLPRPTNVSWPATEFDMRAMGMLYNATYVVIDFIAHKQAYPEG